MKRTIISVGETLEELSVLSGAPSCAVLRANRVFSPAWLLPGREIILPDADFCRTDGDFPCPTRALFTQAADN